MLPLRAVEVPSCSLEGLGLEEAPEAGSNSLLARAWAPGWSNADRALESFLRGALASYATARTKTDTTTTSLLSPHLHFGEVGLPCVSFSPVAFRLI
jgi:cryptochrome 1